MENHGTLPDNLGVNFWSERGGAGGGGRLRRAGQELVKFRCFGEDMGVVEEARNLDRLSWLGLSTRGQCSGGPLAMGRVCARPV